MTSSSGNIFHFTGPLCGEFTGSNCQLSIIGSDNGLVHNRYQTFFLSWYWYLIRNGDTNEPCISWNIPSDFIDSSFCEFRLIYELLSEMTGIQSNFDIKISSQYSAAESLVQPINIFNEGLLSILCFNLENEMLWTAICLTFLSVILRLSRPAGVGVIISESPTPARYFLRYS